MKLSFSSSFFRSLLRPILYRAKYQATVKAKAALTPKVLTTPTARAITSSLPR